MANEQWAKHLTLIIVCSLGKAEGTTEQGVPAQRTETNIRFCKENLSKICPDCITSIITLGDLSRPTQHCHDEPMLDMLNSMSSSADEKTLKNFHVTQGYTLQVRFALLPFRWQLWNFFRFLRGRGRTSAQVFLDCYNPKQIIYVLAYLAGWHSKQIAFISIVIIIITITNNNNLFYL